MKKRQISNSKKGFTLAEVLITLGIIGIVAEITIPTLMQNMAKQQTVEKFKKGYTTLAQAIKLSEVDNGPNQYWNLSSGSQANVKSGFDTYIAPYFKIVKYCDPAGATDCGYTITSLYKLDGTAGFLLNDPTTRMAVALTDGTILFYRASDKTFFIDTNGAKPPNMFGKDVFHFILDPVKGMMPYGFDQNATAISDSCKKGSDGFFCPSKIMMDGWQMKSDYPW